MAGNRQKDFIAEIKTKGIARTNRFTVDFSPPKAMPETTKRMLLFCEKASLPGINFATTANRSYGETTIARILAKSLNCEQGVSSTPCGVCSACQQIDAGRFVDYIEMDAASNRGVDEMVQLLEQATFLPSVGRYKVYMIDEVHQLTAHAFNSMLKTLEEPPAHVKFILATTDPQNIS